MTTVLSSRMLVRPGAGFHLRLEEEPDHLAILELFEAVRDDCPDGFLASLMPKTRPELADWLFADLHGDWHQVLELKGKIVGHVAVTIPTITLQEYVACRDKGTIPFWVSALGEDTLISGFHPAAIHRLIVHPDFRGLGVGSRLLSSAVEHIRVDRDSIPVMIVPPNASQETYFKEVANGEKIATFTHDNGTPLCVYSFK